MIHHIRNSLRQHEPLQLDKKHDERKRAAVLVPIVDASDPRILLTERAGSLDAHGGEVAFPGGREDETDTSLIHTALRETEEEVGLHAGAIEVVGELRPFISKYGLHVTPFVGLVPDAFRYSPNVDEIASIFEVPLYYFGATEPVRVDEISRHGETHRVEVYDFEGYEIWGLTAMILAEFFDVIRASGK